MMAWWTDDYSYVLTHWRLVTQCGAIDLGQHWAKLRIDARQHQAFIWDNVALSSVKSSAICTRKILREKLKMSNLVWVQNQTFRIAATSPRGEWVNSLRPSDAYMRHQTRPSWVQIMVVAWSAPSHYLNQWWNIVNWTLETNFSETAIEIHTFSFKKMHLKLSSGK